MTKRLLTALALVLLFPFAGFAATQTSPNSLTISEPVPANTYLAASNVTINAPLPADLTAAGGSVNVYAPVSGDILAAAGTVEIDQPVGGDVRALGGKVIVNADVTGDVAAAGGTISVNKKARGLYLAGGTVTATGGAGGPVTIYGTNITLGGDIAGDVEIIASDRFTIADGAHIHGKLRYNAPEQAVVPQNALIDGGVTYTGSYAYVPTNEEAHKFAIAGAGIFFVVRTLAGMIVAGLLVGTFPIFAVQVAGSALRSRPRRTLLYILLGFAIFIVAPILILFLLLSFVGAGIALLLGVLYLLLLLLSYIYAGIIAGAALRHAVFSRIRGSYHLTWRDAALGVLALNIIAFVPVIGSLLKFVLALLAAGILVTTAYHFAGSRVGGEQDLELEDETAA